MFTIQTDDTNRQGELDGIIWRKNEQTDCANCTQIMSGGEDLESGLLQLVITDIAEGKWLLI